MLPIESYNDELIIAASTGATEAVELLLDNGADIHTGNNAALQAALLNNHKETSLLLIKRGADVNNGVQAPQCTACQYGSLELAQLLLDHGA